MESFCTKKIAIFQKHIHIKSLKMSSDHVDPQEQKSTTQGLAMLYLGPTKVTN